MPELDLPASALVDAIDDALLVVTDSDDIVECNQAFREIIGVEDGDEALETALADQSELKEQVRNREEGIIPVESGSGEEYYQLSISPVDSEVADDLELVFLHDVTDQQRQQRELERENEQLDQFASFISHDLRNPLDVAIGRTTVIGELVDDPQIEEHLEEIKASHARMIRIIQDVLTLARQGQSIDDKSEVQLSLVAQDAWSHVETNGAEIEIATDQTVLADQNRLGQVFENLFRNSIEHGTGDDADGVQIRVGELSDEDGFYVADDGLGIEPEARNQVLEAGYSDEEDGTGLGLAIVSNIAEAHSWDISVTESESGGARFDFVDVDVVSAD